MIDVDLPTLEQAILAVDGVAAMHGGRYGTIATYLPGRRVYGLHVEDSQSHVHLTVYEGQDMVQVAESVRRVAARLIGCEPQSVIITIEDLVPFPTDASTDQETS